jgi:hypothetical protein
MVRIENNGEFVAGVDQGRYRVAVEDLPFGYWVKSIKYGSSDITREPLNVGVGASSQLEITLTRIPQSPRGVTLSGRVPKIPPEIPAGQTWVTLISNGPEKSRTGAVKLGSDGAFEFKGVPAGNYRLGTIVTAAVNGLTWDRNAAIKVVVMDEDLTMDASIFEGSSVAIRVVDRNGKGIESGPNLSVTFTPLVVGDPIDLIIGGALAVEAPGPTGIPRALLPSGAYDVVVSNDGSRSFQMLSVKSVTSGAVNLRKERLSANGQTPVEPIIITLN